MKDIAFHPFAEDYPLMPDHELVILADVMRRPGGYDPRFPIVLYQKKILDGRNRFLAARAAKVEPLFVEFNGNDDEARDFVVTANEQRRHLPHEWLTRQRQERIDRIAAARINGQSLRAIAQEEGVSPTQVMRDLETATVTSDVTVEPPEGKVTGLDGRTRTATPVKPAPILCSRCQRNLRIGKPVVKGCSLCREDRAAEKPKDQPAKPKPEKPAAVDAFGNELPERCRHAYQDPWIQETIDWLGTASATFWGQRMADAMKKRHKHFPFFNEKDFIDGCGFAGNYIDDLLNHLKENRPAGVCPACQGSGCADCKLSGMVPRKLYAQLKEKHANP